MLHIHLQSGNNVTIEGYSAVHEGNTDNYVPKWFTGTAITGTGASISAVIANSKAGDMYLNTSTDNVYKSSSVNVWDYVCNIKGNTGATGATGATGPQGPQGPAGTTPTSIAWGNITNRMNKSDIQALNYINGSRSDLPRICWHIPNVTWGNIFFNADDYFYFQYGDTTGNRYLGIYAASFTNPSDRKNKKSITSISEQNLEELFNVSDKLLKKFTWKPTGEDSYGFIAQEIIKFIPEAVRTDLNKNKAVDYTIAYAKILASVINKLKEKCKDIEDIKARISRNY